jgi:hypothetical protein
LPVPAGNCDTVWFEKELHDFGALLVGERLPVTPANISVFNDVDMKLQ